MGKLKSSITPQHWLQLKRFLFNRLLHLLGFTTINFFILACLYRKLLKKRRLHSQREPTIIQQSDYVQYVLMYVCMYVRTYVEISIKIC